MPASEYTNECDTRYSVCHMKYKHKRMNTQESKERKFEKKSKREGVSYIKGTVMQTI